MTADELLSLIRALPDARRLPADPPLMAGAMVAGIEIASAGPAPDRALRRIWRERRGGGATPLLLLTEDTGRPGSVRALGLVDAAVPIRSVEAGALHEAIRRLASRPRLEAVRELAAELDRLDQEGSRASSFVSFSRCTPWTCGFAATPRAGSERKRRPRRCAAAATGEQS